MSRRKSIEIERYRHSNPIPAASVVGNLLMSGIIIGRDAVAGEKPETLEDQCRLIFSHIRSILETAGGSTEDIIKINVWLKDTDNRDALNAEWVAMFPDPDSRPARHIQPDYRDTPNLISCDVIAVLS